MDKRARLFWMARIVIVLILLAGGFYFATTKKHFDTNYNKIESFDNIEPLGIQKGDMLEQTISFNADKINSLGICAVNRTNNCAGSINISIVKENNSTVWNENVNVDSVQLQKMTWFKIQQPVDRQKEYTLILSADEMSGTLYIGTIDADKSSQGVGENAVKNGMVLTKPMVVEATFYARLDKGIRLLIIMWTAVFVIYILGFERLFRDKKSGLITLALTADLLAISIYFRVGFKFYDSLNYVIFAGLVAAFFITAVIYLVLLFKNIEKVELYFAVSTLIFGVVYSLVLQPFSMPDEPFHFAEAYRLSNAIMGQPINDEKGYIYMRECDINERVTCPGNSYTIDMLKQLVRGNNDCSENMVPSESARNIYSPIIMYVPQAIGVTIGRLLHVNYVRLIFLGRLMNLLMFTFLTYWAIKIMPCGKWILYAICQIPMVLETVSSCSYDTLILALTFVFIAYLLKLYTQEEKISTRQLGILALVAFLYAPLKPTYVPFVALVFLLPDQKLSDEKWKSQTGKLMVMGAAFLAVLFVHKFQLMSMLQVQNEIQYASVEAVRDEKLVLELSESYKIENNEPYELPTMQFMMENPFNLIESFMGAYMIYADEYLLALFGCGLGHLWDLHNPTYIGILTMILVYIAYKKSGGQQTYLVGLKGRLWTLFLMAGSLFGIFLTMYLTYTEASSKKIGGVQGRYMLPLLIMLPLFMKKDDSNNEHTKEGIVMLSLMVQVLAVLSVCMEICNRG